MTLREQGVRAEGFRSLSVGAIGSDLTHIETVKASGDSSIDFTNVFSSDYDRYVVFVDNLLPSDNGVHLQARYSSDGGSNWDSGSSDYARVAFEVYADGSTGTTGDSGDGVINLTRPFVIGNDASNNDLGSVSFVISDPTNPNRATVLRNSSVHYRNDLGTSFRTGMNGGIRLAQSSIDSIRLFMSSGNVSSGIFSVYGVDQ